jgi:hypothetical protein
LQQPSIRPQHTGFLSITAHRPYWPIVIFPHVAWLLARRIERFDPYSHIDETDPLLLGGGSGVSAAAISHGRYDVDGQHGLESTLERLCAEALATVGNDSSDGSDSGSGKEAWEYLSARAMCGNVDSTCGVSAAPASGGSIAANLYGCVGPQDLEEQIDVGYTRDTDGLGFCAAWCFFLAECRMLNPDVPSASLVTRVVGQLARRPAEEWSELAQAAALAEFSKHHVARVYDAGRAYATKIVSTPGTTRVGSPYGTRFVTARVAALQITHRDAISACRLNGVAGGGAGKKGRAIAVQEFLPPCSTEADAIRVMQEVENTAAELLRLISARSSGSPTSDESASAVTVAT